MHNEQGGGKGGGGGGRERGRAAREGSAARPLSPAEVRKQLPFEAAATSDGLGWPDAVVAEAYRGLGPEGVQIGAESHHRLAMIQAAEPGVRLHCAWDGVESDVELPAPTTTTTLPTTPAFMSLVPAGRCHEWEWTGGAIDGRVVLLPQACLAAAAEALEVPGEVELLDRHHLDDPKLARLVAPLFNHLEGRDALAGTLAAEAIAGLVANHLLRHHTPHYPHRLPRRRRASSGRLTEREQATLQRLVLGRLDEQVPVAELAAAVGRSVDHFGRVLRATTGRTPQAFVLRVRAEAAVRHLRRHPREGLSEVAARCGFSDQSHLGRSVRKFFGLTPAQLRGAGR